MRRAWFFVLLAALALLIPMTAVISAPHAAWVKYAANPVFRPSPSGSWDDRNVYAAKVLLDGSTYKLWYTGNGYSNASPRIGYATSPDGITWTRLPSPVLTPDSGRWDGKGVSAPAVLYKDGIWHMWYAGKDITRYSIGYATSPDGMTWTKHPSNPVLTASAEGSADDVDTVSPHVLFQGGLFHMWYAGRGDSNQIFYATSPDGVNWTKHTNNPVLQVGGDYDWDNGEIAAPSVIWTGAQFEMWYQGYSRGTLQRYIGHATSPDGVTWTKDALNPVLGLEAGAWDSYSVYYPSVVLRGDGQLMLWYQGEGGEGQQKQLGLATFQLNVEPTPLPTFPTESPVDVTLTPVTPVTPSPTPTPTATWTPVPVHCSDTDGNHCVLLPAVSK